MYNTIKISRIICIFFMTFVHVNPGKEKWINLAPNYLIQINWLLADILGRASVPALSLIGGWLAMMSISKRAQWWGYVSDRAKKLLLPMLAWNLFVVLISFLIFKGTGKMSSILERLSTQEEVMPLRVINALLGVSNGSATEALNFLRDVFVCSLFAFVIKKALETWAFGVLLAVLTWGVTLGFAPIVMRPHIFMFFVIGAYVFVRGKQQSIQMSVIEIVGAILLINGLLFAMPTLSSLGTQFMLETNFRLAVSSLMLLACMGLSKTPWGQTLAKAEPYIFTLYLSHTTTMLVLWGAWQIIFGKEAYWPYIVFYLMAPVLSCLGAYVLCRANAFTQLTSRLRLN